MANQELHQRQLRVGPMQSSVKRCRSIKDRNRLWKVGVRDLGRDICCALHHSGFVFPLGSRRLNRDKLNCLVCKRRTPLVTYRCSEQGRPATFLLRFHQELQDRPFVQVAPARIAPGKVGVPTQGCYGDFESFQRRRIRRCRERTSGRHEQSQSAHTPHHSPPHTVPLHKRSPRLTVPA